MIRIDLNASITDIAGIPVMMSPSDPSILTVGKAIGSILQNYRGSRFNAMKAMELAFSCWRENSIELMESDLQVLKDIIEETYTKGTIVGFGALIFGQIQKALIS